MSYRGDDGYEVAALCPACGDETGGDVPCCDEEAESMGEQPNEVWLVDGNGVFHRYWHASAGDNVNSASDGVVALCHRLKQQTGAHVVCCFDPGGETWRHKLYSGYKANREAPDPALIAQLERTQRRLEADGFPVVVKQGFEADDTIAALTEWCLSVGVRKVYIASDDKDLMQLVSECVTQYRPRDDRDGTFANGFYEAIEVHGKWGVAPHQLGDLLALMGDKSDNVPGVRGCGEKRAAEYLQAWGSIDGIRKALNDGHRIGGPKTTEALRAALCAEVGEPPIRLSQRLVSLRADSLSDAECAAAMQPKTPRPVEAPPRDFSKDDDDMPERRDEIIPPPADTMPGSIEAEPVSGPPSAPPSAPRAMVKAAPQQSRPRPVKGTPEWNGQLEPRSGAGAWTMAQALAKSSLTPYRTPDEILAIMVLGRGYGMGVWDSLQNMSCIKGKVTMDAGPMMGLVLSKPVCEYFTVIETTDKVATYETKRRGSPNPVRLSFTIEQAKRANLTGKQTWQQYPEAMLRARATSALARMVYPDVVANVYLPEELGADHAAEVAA